MKNVIIGLLISLVLLGCSSKETEQNVEQKLVVEKSLEGLTLNDQHEKPHTITADTKTLIFAFSKDMGHACNNFFATKDDSYLSNNHALFIADVSAAPSIIRNMFIMPGLKDFKHTVLVIDDENLANGYKLGIDSDKIIVVSIENNIITDVKSVNTVEEMAAEIEAK